MPTMFPASGVDELVRSGASCRVAVDIHPAFKPGDMVRALNINPVTHTRLPQYVRGKRGVIIEDRGVFVFPDTNSLLKGERPQHVYSVMFAAEELWGPGSSRKDKCYLDLWEDYMALAKD
jgi:nitrile hydratase subunit beta